MRTGTTPAERAPALAGLLPDEPGWIDLKGLLLSGRCEVWAEADPARGFVAGSWDYPFAALWERPGRELIAAATAAGLAACQGRYPVAEWQLLAAPRERRLVADALSGWRRQGIALHRWRGPLDGPAPDAGLEVLLLPAGHREAELDLAAFPEPSRYEYELDWVSRRPTAVAMADGRPVSLCYAAFTTETLWDVSIETVESFRRRGLAAACFLTLAAHMAEVGKLPAWGSMLDNPASLGLAAKLGFVRDASLDGWSTGG